MRLPRFRLRTVLLTVALISLALAGWKVVVDGPRTHWLLLKLRFGGLLSLRDPDNKLSGPPVGRQSKRRLPFAFCPVRRAEVTTAVPISVIREGEAPAEPHPRLGRSLALPKIGTRGG
jgi:hypothetical protein